MINSIAVFPFEMIKGEISDEWLKDHFSESLTFQLGSMKNFLSPYSNRDNNNDTYDYFNESLVSSTPLSERQSFTVNITNDF